MHAHNQYMNLLHQIMIKLPRKGLKKKTKMVVNTLTISIHFNIEPLSQELHVYDVYMIITETQYDWLSSSLFDQPKQCIEFISKSQEKRIVCINNIYCC